MTTLLLLVALLIHSHAHSQVTQPRYNLPCDHPYGYHFTRVERA
jgi:hypothetical protein